jgi:hypothetical protein
MAFGNHALRTRAYFLLYNEPATDYSATILWVTESATSPNLAKTNMPSLPARPVRRAHVLFVPRVGYSWIFTVNMTLQAQSARYEKGLARLRQMPVRDLRSRRFRTAISRASERELT